MRFSKGARRTAAHKLARRVPLQYHPAVARVLAGTLPDSFSLKQFAPQVFDQGQTGSCTANASSAGVFISFAAQGKPLNFVPSQRELYAATRAFERATSTPVGQPLPALTDSGAELADVYSVLASYGACPMLEQQTSDGRYSDVEVASVNAEPLLASLEAGQQSLVVGPYGLDPSTADLSDVLAAALVALVPIGIATFVDTAFENLAAGAVAGAPNQNDPDGGGHALLFSGFQKQPDGTRAFEIRNSWGTVWSSAGYGLGGPAFVGSCWEFHPLSCQLVAGGAP